MRELWIPNMFSKFSIFFLAHVVTIWKQIIQWNPEESELLLVLKGLSSHAYLANMFESVSHIELKNHNQENMWYRNLASSWREEA